MNQEARNKERVPLISIIIAAFNSGQHLRDCLESIRNQLVKNIEVVVVDGGSTDNTISILQDFKDLDLQWTSEPDQGIYDALNKGIKKAKGRWLHFLGSDDRLLPGFSELAIKLKDENTIYYGDSQEYYIGNTKPPYILLKGKFSQYRLAKYCMNHQAIIYPSKAFSKYQYNTRYIIFADYDLNIRLWGDRGFKKVYYPITIALYNMNGMSSVTKDVLFKKEKPRLIREGMGWFVYLRYMLKYFKKELRGETDFKRF